MSLCVRSAERRLTVMRESGILMHISSLPSPGGIGTLGAEAYEFADFLFASGMRIWQVLPIGPTGYGESPYQSASTFAGNPLLIDMRLLREKGLLSGTDKDDYVPAEADRVDYDSVRLNKTV
ncbi:MAG: 4-alpha-glucanotransferase, partial [Clostridia bacterium]|nr:4-alpha-glucanotransferase [Clostridia bacterium]